LKYSIYPSVTILAQVGFVWGYMNYDKAATAPEESFSIKFCRKNNEENFANEYWYTFKRALYKLPSSSY
jgi:hypothetical protein